MTQFYIFLDCKKHRQTFLKICPYSNFFSTHKNFGIQGNEVFFYCVVHNIEYEQIRGAYLKSISVIYDEVLNCLTNSVDTGLKLNVHKTFRRRRGRLRNVLCTFNLCSVPIEKSCLLHLQKDQSQMFDKVLNTCCTIIDKKYFLDDREE